MTPDNPPAGRLDDAKVAVPHKKLVIEATPDWEYFKRGTNCPAPSLILDDSFAACRSIYTERSGVDAPASP